MTLLDDAPLLMPEVLPTPNDVDATEMREVELEPDNTETPEPVTETPPALNVIEVPDTIEVEMTLVGEGTAVEIDPLRWSEATVTCELLANTTVSETLESELGRIELGFAVKLLKTLVATVDAAESSSDTPDTAGRVALTGLLTVLESEETDATLSEEVPSGSGASLEDNSASTDDTPLDDGIALGEGTIPD